LFTLSASVTESTSLEELQGALARADMWLSKCLSINKREMQCLNNYGQIYAQAGRRTAMLGQNAVPTLQRAHVQLSALREMGGHFLDAEQHLVLADLLLASDQQRRAQDPTAALAEVEADLGHCFAIAPQDAMCRTLAARAEWVRADWLAAKGQQTQASLERALAKAELAAQSPEVYPDAWQALAEAHLRLARAELKRPKVRDAHIAAGQAAAAKIFTINPNHALGHATQGALELLRAQAPNHLEAQRTAASAAALALQLAIQNDAFLAQEYTPLLEKARSMARAL
jgi:hypothetical protein